MEAHTGYRGGVTGRGGLLLLAALVLCLGVLLASSQPAQAAGPPSITAVTPSSGPVSGGNNVILTGVNFIGATSVRFGTTPALFLVNNDSQITTIAPASGGGTGTVNVFVTTPDGTSIATFANRYTYLSSTVVTGLSPEFGPASGGTTVTVFGAGFTGATSVTFGGIEAPFIVDNDGRLRALSPAVGVSAVVHVRVTSPSGTSPGTAASEFTYFGAELMVTGLTPSFGPVVGGNTVIITGTGFFGVHSVRFGAHEASFFVQNSTKIIATAPPAAGSGVVHVIVYSGPFHSPLSDASRYTYLAATPTVTDLNPDSGPVGGGTVVMITGTNFTGATSVTFGGVAASFVVHSSTKITATAPGGVGAGVVTVRVTTPAGTSIATASANYAYQAPPGPLYCPTGPFWMDDLAYGSAGGGFYWDPVSGQVWTSQRDWHNYSPRPPRTSNRVYWADAPGYGSAGVGFYWDPVSGQVWTAERDWHRFDPQGCVRR